MNKGMYPMSQLDRSQYATPTQVPLGAQAVSQDYDPATNPLTGEPTSRFAKGGDVEEKGVDFSYLVTPEGHKEYDPRFMPFQLDNKPLTAPQMALLRLQAEKELGEGKLRAAIMGNLVAVPGERGVRGMPGNYEVGYNTPAGIGNLDISAIRAMRGTPDGKVPYGVNASYTIPFAQGGIAHFDGADGSQVEETPRDFTLGNPDLSNLSYETLVDSDRINSLNSLKETDPKQYKVELMNALGESLKNQYNANENYEPTWNQFSELKSADPAQWNRNQLSWLGHQQGWQIGQNRSDRNEANMPVIQDQIEQAKKAGLGEDEINNILGSSSQAANVQNQNRIIRQQQAGNGPMGMTTQDYLTVAAILGSGAAAAYFGPAMAASGALEAGGGLTAAGTTAGAAGTTAGTTAAGTGLGTGLAGGTATGTGITAGTTGIGMTGATTGGIGITGTAASTTPAWMVAAGKGAMVGAAMGGGKAALTGGDVVKGTVYGGVTGAVGGAAGSALGGGYAGNMTGGALAGATGSALRGGNVAEGAGMGAVGGAINTGIGGLDASPESKGVLQHVGTPLAMSTIAGAMGGGQSNQGSSYNPGNNPYGVNAGNNGQYVPFNAGITPNIPSYNPTSANPFAISGMMPNSLYYGYKPATFNYGPRYAQGGIADLGSYSDGGRLLKGPGDGMSDDIPASIGDKQPARLADGEFVIPADVVSHLGNGSTDAGAKHLYKMMEKIRHARTGNRKQGKQINPDKFLPKE